MDILPQTTDWSDGLVCCSPCGVKVLCEIDELCCDTLENTVK